MAACAGPGAQAGRWAQAAPRGRPDAARGPQRLVDADSRGDPESLLSLDLEERAPSRRGAARAGPQAHFTTVAQLLRGLGYSLQANVKTREGTQHPDRDAQFRHINDGRKRAVEHRQPVISVDTKKKELVGDFKNAGREWRPRATRSSSASTTSRTSSWARRSPTASTTSAHDQGWVNVGIDHDTAQFAVNSIRSWWEHLGQPRYPNATTLQITADCGGSNGNRTRLWKVELQALADQTGLEIAVCHFPPGTSKWNRIEHRLFSFITINWRGKPLVSLETIISLIGATTTSTGLARSMPASTQAPTPKRSRSPTPTSRPSISTQTSSTPNGTTASNTKVNYLQNPKGSSRCCSGCAEGRRPRSAVLGCGKTFTRTKPSTRLNEY